MVMTINTPVQSESSSSNALTLSVQTIVLPEGSPVPGSGNLKLGCSLIVQVEITGDGFVIQSGDIDEEAYGSSFDEAYIDFLTSLRDRLESLNRREESLSSRDKAVLQRLRLILQSN